MSLQVGADLLGRVRRAAEVDLLQRHAPLYAHQQPPGSSFTLRVRLLDGLATCAQGDAARDHLLRHAAGAGVLPGQVGS